MNPHGKEQSSLLGVLQWSIIFQAHVFTPNMLFWELWSVYLQSVALLPIASFTSEGINQHFSAFYFHACISESVLKYQM